MNNGTRPQAEDASALCRTCAACCSYSLEWPRFSLENDAVLDLIPPAFVDDEQGRMRCDGDRCTALVGDVGVSTCARSMPSGLTSVGPVCRETTPAKRPGGASTYDSSHRGIDRLGRCKQENFERFTASKEARDSFSRPSTCASRLPWRRLLPLLRRFAIHRPSNDKGTAVDTCRCDLRTGFQMARRLRDQSG